MTSYTVGQGFAARSYAAYGADPLYELERLLDRLVAGETPVIVPIRVDEPGAVAPPAPLPA